MDRNFLNWLLEEFDGIVTKIESDIQKVLIDYQNHITTEDIRDATLERLAGLQHKLTSAILNTHEVLKDQAPWRKLRRKVFGRFFQVKAAVLEHDSESARELAEEKDMIMQDFDQDSEQAIQAIQAIQLPQLNRAASGSIPPQNSDSRSLPRYSQLSRTDINRASPSLPRYSQLSRRDINRASPSLPGYASQLTRTSTHMSIGSGNGSRFSSSDGSVRRVEYASASSSQGREYFSEVRHDDYSVNAGNEPEWTSDAAEGSNTQRHQVYGDPYFDQAFASSGSIDPYFSSSYRRQAS